MPKVGGKKFPYTAKGRDQAAQYRKRLKKKKKSVKKEGRSVKTMGGKYAFGSLGAPVKAIKVKPTPKSKEPKEEKMPKKKKKSDQTKQSAKRHKARGGRTKTPLDAYHSTKRYA